MTVAEGIAPKDIDLKQVLIGDESYYRISNHDQMPPFFMSIVSDSNHWMFISSNGGLTAGRKNSDYALFPYYTDDKLTELAEITGSKSIFWVTRNGLPTLWEPFSVRSEGRFECTRNLYKNTLGNKIVFEEINHDLEVTFRYRWSSSNEFGFVRESFLINNSTLGVEVRLLDGIQNILPASVPAFLQEIRSNLVDAYKRTELEPNSGLAIFNLSSVIVDRAEPSEALKANVAWSIGLDVPIHLLSSDQLTAFRQGEQLTQEEDIKARKGAYLLSTTLHLSDNEMASWMILANVNQGPNEIAALIQRIQTEDSLTGQINEDVEVGCHRLEALVSASDGMQLTSDKKRNARHYSNTLFNIMRGGIFDFNYQVEKWDFEKYLKNASKKIYQENRALIKELPDLFTQQELKAAAQQSKDAGFIRLALEYLPLKFSRRHGDPSRPWNRFSINTRSEEDGSKVLDYEGNWRDIFQNWEALAHSYPEFIESMILKFLNASTFDGYNPYRVTKGGFDWESIEPHDPWSYIGYWGDHQIIYLLKFLEFMQGHYPARLAELFSEEQFVYANVPYKIKPYEELLANPKDTIVFDDDLDISIRKSRDAKGADGAIIERKDGQVYTVNFIEKILATVLAKVSNFIPEGGIWMNTQRPEWNDANNALVGNGVSMVTLCYLHRFFTFFKEVLGDGKGTVTVSEELQTCFEAIHQALNKHQGVLAGSFSNKQRRQVLDEVGIAASKYRQQIYEQGFAGKKTNLTLEQVSEFFTVGEQYLAHSITANKRADGMYHAYNLMTVENEEEISISYLDEMLEGQVAALSSGHLSSQENLDLLNALKSSKLFREDQYSYLLYPNKELPQYLHKNVIPKEYVMRSDLLQRLLKDGNGQVITQDVNGAYHFNPGFNNADFLDKGLDKLPTEYAELVKKERESVLAIYENVFNHKAFTGRSGTFYGYEGLGSIYWHMVSKLLLAVEEVALQAVHEGASAEIIGGLLEHYYEINEGIGVHKSPELYGAFPIDPYSHTPMNKGAQQPGMTGQVKEDIISRIGELGVFVREGGITFDPCLLRANEFLTDPAVFHFVDLDGERQSFEIPADSLAFTYCQVPVVYQIADKDQIVLSKVDGFTEKTEGLSMDPDDSESVFQRSGEIKRISVHVTKSHLK